MRQYRSRRIIRIVLRCFGIYLAGSALFAAAFQIGNRAVAESRVGILIWLVCSFLCGGILLALSFFVPKLPRYRDTIGAGSPVCAGCSTRLSDLKDTEILIADGRRYCDVCAKRLFEAALKHPVQKPVQKPYTCVRCKKQIGEQDCVWIGDHRFCRDCANAANQIILKAERYKEPKYREPTGPTGLCSRCRSRVPLKELVFKDLADCVCKDCYQKIVRFPILQLHVNPCMQYEDCENLDVCVAKDGYVVNHYGFDPGDGHYFVIPTGFFANASWDAIAAILNAASPSGRGFGFGKKKRLSADDIKNNEAVQKLIQYDDNRKKHMRFSGGEHGDTVDLRIQPDGTVMVNCSNDGEGNRMAAGGYSRPMPEELVHNYDQSRFIVWLQANFWLNSSIQIYLPADENKVRSFLTEGLKRRMADTEASTQKPEIGETASDREYGRVFAMHDDRGTRFAFRIHERKSAGGGGETSGYGWRDWLFFCHANDAPYLLQYNDCSEGCGWFAVPLSQEDVLKIVQGPDERDDPSTKNAAYWLWFRMLSEHLRKENVIRYLHPDDIAEARELLDGGFSFHGKLTDEEIAGLSGNPQSKTKES